MVVHIEELKEHSGRAYFWMVKGEILHFPCPIKTYLGRVGNGLKRVVVHGVLAENPNHKVKQKNKLMHFLFVSDLNDHSNF